MQAPSVVETSNMTDRPRREASSDADAFGAVLIDAQAASALASTAALSDATGLEPAGDGEPPNARHARIIQETETARRQDAQQSRADRAPIQSKSSTRLHESRSAEARQAAATEKSSPQPEARTARSASATEGVITASPQRGDPAEPTQRVATDTAKLPPERTPQVQSPAAKLRESEPARSTESNARPVVAVATAGAAKAAEASASGRSSAAEAVGRMLGGRVEAVRAPAQAQASAQPGSDQPQTRTSARSTQTQQSNPNPNAKESGGTQAARRPDFLQLVRMLRASLGARESSATLRLDPPELGRMKVDVRMSEDNLHLRVEVASDRARDLLHARIDDLTNALREHDIRMEKIEIVTVDAKDQPGQGSAHGFADTRDASRGAQEQSQSSTRSTHRQTPGEAEVVESIEETTSSAQLDVRV